LFFYWSGMGVSAQQKAEKETERGSVPGLLPDAEDASGLRENVGPTITRDEEYRQHSPQRTANHSTYPQPASLSDGTPERVQAFEPDSQPDIESPGGDSQSQEGKLPEQIVHSVEHAAQNDDLHQAKKAKETANTRADQDEQELAHNRGTEMDPRVAAMREEQERLQGEIQKLEGLNAGSENQIQSWEKDRATLGVMDRIFGTTSTLKEQIQSEKDEIERRKEQVAELHEKLVGQEEIVQTLKDAEGAGKSLQNEAIRLQQEGRVEEAAEVLAEAQQSFNYAQQQVDSFLAITGERASLFSERYLQAQQDALQSYTDVANRIGTTESVLRTTQRVTIIAGATIATGGAAGAVIAGGGGFLAAGAVGIGAGTTVGSAIGGASASVEAGGHVVHGNKTTDEALKDALHQTSHAAKDSVVSSVGTIAGIGIGSRVAGAVTSKIGGTSGTVLGGAANGATAGGTAATISSSAEVAQRYQGAMQEFNDIYAGIELTTEQRAELRGGFLAERGLTTTEIIRRVAADAAIGTAGGAIGGATGASRTVVRSNRAALAAEAGQAGGDVTVGVGAAALQGDLSIENIAGSVAGAVIGNTAGRISQRVDSQTAAGVQRNQAATRVSQGNAPETTVKLQALPDNSPGIVFNRRAIPRDIDPETIVVADPKTIRTSQTDVGPATLTKVTQHMRENGFIAANEKTKIGNAVEVVRMPDGGATSLDNRRIMAAETAGVPVLARIRGHGEPLTGSQRSNFKQPVDRIPDSGIRDRLMQRADMEVRVNSHGKMALVPLTWGAAAELRIATQPSVEFVRNNPYGSITTRPQPLER